MIEKIKDYIREYNVIHPNKKITLERYIYKEELIIALRSRLDQKFSFSYPYSSLNYFSVNLSIIR
jgi:hypothetical protein